MLWSRRSVLITGAAALAGCGFEPVNTVHPLMNRVSVSEPFSRESFLLVQRLEERLGRTPTPDYQLGLALNISSEGLAEDAEGTIRRFTLLGRADYTVKTFTSGAPIAAGSVQAFSSYDSAGTTIATQAGRRDATQRLMTILADKIVVRLQTLDP